DTLSLHDALPISATVPACSVQSSWLIERREIGMAVRLSTSNLEAVERLGVGVPHYDRSALVARILHLGVGGFHRAHLARYVDELAGRGENWAIRGVGLLDSDRAMASVLDSQNHLYTLI